MKFKNLITGMSVVAIFTATTTLFGNSAYAKNTNSCYEQVNKAAQKIYSGIYNMSKSGILEMAKTEERGFEVSITATNPETNLQKIEPGEEFEVSVNIGNFSNIGEGIISLMGQLEYDANILERISITGQNGWDFDDESINPENLKFITNSSKRVTEDCEMFRIILKAKDTITETTETTIKIKGISASGGYGVIATNDAQANIKIEKIEEEKTEIITSEKYIINNEDKDISRIAPKTTVAEFKNNIVTQNVTTDPIIVITDSEGNTLAEGDELRTGMIVKVGKTLEYTLIVIGDIDGDLEEDAIGINDLAKLKLHLIDYEHLTGIKLKAADVDGTGELDINDVAQIKLVLIGLMEIE